MKRAKHRPKRHAIHIHYIWRQYLAAIRRGDYAGGLNWMKLLNLQIDVFRRARGLDDSKPKRKSIRRNRTFEGARKSPHINRRAQRAARDRRKPAPVKLPTKKARR
jgi:hypothetical protein